jgi:hypothetical protein
MSALLVIGGVWFSILGFAYLDRATRALTRIAVGEPSSVNPWRWELAQGLLFPAVGAVWIWKALS